MKKNNNHNLLSDTIHLKLLEYYEKRYLKQAKYFLGKEVEITNLSYKRKNTNPKYKLLGWNKYMVLRFQKSNGLITNGLVGFRTMDKMIENGKVSINSEAFLLWKSYNPDYNYKKYINRSNLYE